ncbi:ATP-dependent zinc protease [Modicisalibacter coralii]|uniref:ATP-dependent zinc protease family protein n=1 Tax=Modicisalibacter coralii TaxID=2304602 RepID=UPI00100A29F4|nr:ATP-dependent zinc protease [Halomonas coralii]
MPIRHSRPAIAAGLLLLLGGCALPASQDPRLDTLLTTSRFDDRIAELENTLAAQCAVDAARRDDTGQRLAVLQGDVRAATLQLKALRGDLQQRDSEPAIKVPDCPTSVDPSLENMEVVGRSEWVGFPTLGTYLKARLDTGANTGSLSARDITEFERDGEDWVRFKLALEDDAVVVDSVRDRWIEAEITRRVRIIQASGEESRPVISLLMRLGPIKQNVEFTLNDRTHLTYPVLLGRRFMRDIVVVDVARHYLYDRPEYPGGAPASAAARDEATDNDDDE